MIRSLIAVLLLGVLLGNAASADERPVVALVLGGGGAKGLAHVGVLQVLEELQVPVDLVVGTSMGAIAGGLYVQGNSADDLAEIVLATDWQALFVDSPNRPLLAPRRRAEERQLPLQGNVGIDAGGPQFRLGVLQGQRLLPTLRSHGANQPVPQSFDDLPVPFRAMAVDIETGQALALEAGDINRAMRASMAIPGVFSPVLWGDRYLVDGGVATNLPVEVARDLGADIIIAVDVVGTLKPQQALRSPFSVVEQALNIVIKQEQSRQLALLEDRDIAILPATTEAEVAAVDFDEAQVAIQVGRAAAEMQTERLEALAVEDAEWARWRQTLDDYRTPFQPEFFRLDNRTTLPDERLWALLRSQTGASFDERAFHQDLERLYGLGYFEQVDYQPVAEANRQGALITAEPSSTGPGYLRLGFAFEEGFANYSRYTAAASYLHTEVNSHGAEWQVDGQVGQEASLGASWWQPLRRDGSVHLTPGVLVERANVNLYEDGGELAGRYRTLKAEGSLALGYSWRSRLDLQLDYRAGVGHAAVQTPGASVPDEGSFDLGALGLQMVSDSLDDTVLPRRGRLFSLRYEASSPALGASADYQSLKLRLVNASTWQRGTLMTDLRYGTALAGELPFHAAWTLGGLLQMSGYSPNELRGQNLILGKMAYWRQMNDLQRFGDLPFFLGGALEAGQVWQDPEQWGPDDPILAATVLSAADTPLGMAILAYSRNTDDRSALVLALNRPF